MDILKIAAFSSKGLCMPCVGVRGTPEQKKAVLDKFAERWNASYEISPDGRYAKFSDKDIVQP